MTYPTFQSYLSRITRGGIYIPEVDGLRFFAILGVVLCHLESNILRLATNEYILNRTDAFIVKFLGSGGYGVRLFFMISGFILSIPFARSSLNKLSSVNIKSYYWRRLTRLEPPYLIIMSIYLAGNIYLQASTLKGILPHYIVSIFYLHVPIYQHVSTLYSPAWSLEVEIHFYLLVPFISRIFSLDTKIRRIIIFFGALFLSILTPFLPKFMNYTIIGNFHFFLLGFLLSDLYLTEEWNSGSFKFDTIGLLAALSSIYMIMNESIVYYILLPFFIMIFCISGFRGHIINLILTNRYITIIGGMCYSIYLLHGRLITLPLIYYGSWVLTGNYTLDIILAITLIGPIIAIGSIIFFVLIERPCMIENWPKLLFSYFAKFRCY